MCIVKLNIELEIKILESKQIFWEKIVLIFSKIEFFIFYLFSVSFLNGDGSWRIKIQRIF